VRARARMPATPVVSDTVTDIVSPRLFVVRSRITLWRLRERRVRSESGKPFGAGRHSETRRGPHPRDGIFDANTFAPFFAVSSSLPSLVTPLTTPGPARGRRQVRRCDPVPVLATEEE
jgi:hypothetical protein